MHPSDGQTISLDFNQSVYVCVLEEPLSIRQIRETVFELHDQRTEPPPISSHVLSKYKLIIELNNSLWIPLIVHVVGVYMKMMLMATIRELSLAVSLLLFYSRSLDRTGVRTNVCASSYPN